MFWASLQPPARPVPVRCSLASCELSRGLRLPRSDARCASAQPDLPRACSSDFRTSSVSQAVSQRRYRHLLFWIIRPCILPPTGIRSSSVCPALASRPATGTTIHQSHCRRSRTLLPSVHGHNASIVSSRTRSYIVLVTCPRSSHLIDIATSWSTGWD
ncbi:hypothetical protein OH76DRAFT_214631 [Lentinus brumalis]|uniref:Uncharacterized protein n=1 Tax=Lentinus brumalis TaxID=2498619 RepID=A0A371CMI4_9APHY|nr:hypothetical protein OH76DRAFT_214631 [Polyporus brumalis]